MPVTHEMVIPTDLLSALKTMVRVADQALDHWDNDQDSKVGKYLSAMSGHLKNYRADLTAVHAIIERYEAEAHRIEQEGAGASAPFNLNS